MRGAGGLLLVFTACSYSHGDVSGSDAPHDVPVDLPPDGPSRVRAGLVALYTFDDMPQAITVADSSGAGAPVDLTIADMNRISWGTGDLTITTPPAIIASPKSVPDNRINVACKASGAITVEVWATSALPDQNGASGQFARIVTMSLNAIGRNFAIGQQGTMWAAQARTSNLGVDAQGSPTLVGGTVATISQHLV